MNTSFTRRAWIYLAAMLGGVALAVSALLLAWQARADHARIRRLANDDLVLAASATEARLLAVRMQLGVTRAVLNPNDRIEGGRFTTHRVLLSDELRRARLHARDHNTVDVVDDLDNRSLAFSGAAERIFEALAANRASDARAMLSALEADGAEVNALADELYTLATASADEHARGLSGGLRSASLLVLALAGVVFAVLAGALAWAESGAAIVSWLALVLPYSVVRRLVREAAKPDGASAAHIVPLPSALATETEEVSDADAASWATAPEPEHAALTNLPAREGGSGPRLQAAELEASAVQLMEELGPQPARSVSFNADSQTTPETEPEPEVPPPLWKPRTAPRASDAA